MMALLAIVLFGLLILAVYLLCEQQPWLAPAATTQTQHLAVDNHTAVNVVVNNPPDFAGVALAILSLVGLVLTIWYIYRSFRDR